MAQALEPDLPFYLRDLHAFTAGLANTHVVAHAGRIFAYFFDRGRGTSNLSVFDATRLTGGPIARIELPQRVPLGFHGSWVPRG